MFFAFDSGAGCKNHPLTLEEGYMYIYIYIPGIYNYILLQFDL